MAGKMGAGEIAYSCPRCQAPTSAEFYGPCEACRGELRRWTLEAPAPAVEADVDARPTTSGVTTSRRYWRHNRRPVLFAPAAGGEAWDADGRRVTVAGAGLAEFLATVAGYRMVYVCADDAAGYVRATFTATADGWTRTGFYPHDAHPSVTFARDADGATVRLAPVGTWTGGPVSPAVAAEAWRWVTTNVAEPFGGQLLATPSTTGRDLMARAFPRDVDLPTLADHVAEEIRATSTQHRMELVAPAGLEVAGMVELDARLAFAAVVRELPAGAPVRMMGEPDEYRPHRIGRYRCRWTVPNSWNGPGILPHLTDDGWRWNGRPGESESGWVDGSELAMARRYGWEVHVAESLVWPDKAACDPLRRWQERLVDAYRQAEAGGGMSDKAAKAAGKMIRSIIIHGLGSLRGKGEVITRTCAPEDAATEVPAGADWWTGDDGTVMWTERREPSWEEWVRPEWTASVWARTRCRLLDAPGATPKLGGKARRTGALNLPPGVDLYGFRGDAMYVSADPRWPDDGRPGRYRVKAEHGPFTMPATLAELDRVRKAGARPVTDSIAAARAALGKGSNDG